MAKKKLFTRQTILNFILAGSVLINIGIITSFIYLKYFKYPSFYRDTVKFSEPIDPGKATFFLIGDSFLSWYSWPVLSSSHKIANYGLGGSGVKLWESRINEILQSNADTILIWVGANDLKTGQNPDSLSKSYLNFVSRFLDRNKTVFCVLLLPVTSHYNDKAQELTQSIEHFNSNLKNNHPIGIKLIDLSNDLVSGEMLDHKFSEDGLHLNAIGYRVADVSIFQQVKNALK